MQLTGSQIVIECLKEQGVDTVFGYPGGAILNVYDELYKHSDEIKHVLTSHEQGASHAADGYARSTGKVGVCLATSGPGATNLVTGIATAYMDSSPVVAITCNVGVSLLGKDSFQEVDIAGITMPITKHNFIVKDIDKLASTIRRAFLIAKRGRPGPVLVDIPKDVTAASAEYEYVEPAPIPRITSSITDEGIKKAVEMIEESRRPFIFIGGGAALSQAEKEVRKFAKLVDAPVCDTLMGKGVFDGTDDHYTGMLGMHGTKVSNFGVSECDLLIAVGTRFSDRILGNPKTFAKQAKILQIDVDPVEINKNLVVDAEIIGDVREVLRKLNPRISQMDHAEWLERINDLKKDCPQKDAGYGLTGPYAVEKIYEKTNGDALICTEVGQHQMWAAQYYKYKHPHQLITSGGAGTMGFGLGASIGTKLGNPDRCVINIAGDGCFRMNLNELATAVRQNAHIVEVIINNRVLGMVRQWQDLFYEKHYSATILEDKMDYVKVAEAFGAKGLRARTPEEFDAALDEALNSEGPVVIDCVIDKDDKVWPMVPPGAPIANAFDNTDVDKMNH